MGLALRGSVEEYRVQCNSVDRVVVVAMVTPSVNTLARNVYS